LKKVEIVIIISTRGENLRQKVLKALANPPRIFYVPYTLAVLNFLVWFIIFIIGIVISIILPPHELPVWLPLVFLGILSIFHMILAFYSKKDPQISQLIFSGIDIFKRKISRKLKV
jgi:type IV secretory pathway VirB3-like protein